MALDDLSNFRSGKPCCWKLGLAKCVLKQTIAEQRDEISAEGLKGRPDIQARQA